MRIEYTPKGVCAHKMIIETNDDKVITSVRVIGGCAGNLLGISKLLTGMPVEEVIETLSGTRCKSKPTSCPDQIAEALKQAL